MKARVESLVVSSPWRHWLKYCCSPRVLLAFTIIMILCQFASQMEMVVRGWFFEWPYWADQDRYIRYALFYRASFAEGGISGLIEAYQTRPPYSFTLLISSLPLLPWAEQTVHVLHFQLGYFLIALDFAVFRLAWRVGKSMYAGIVALVIMHGTTTGIFSSSGFLIPADMLHYQLSFATSTTSVVGLALFVEMLYSKRVGRWSVLLCFFLLGALLLRPSATPFFFAQFIPPAIAVSGWYAWQGRRRDAFYVLIATVMSLVIATPHLLNIATQVVSYAKRAHENFAIYSYTYYWEQSSITTPVFVTCFHLLMLGVICDLPRLYSLWVRAKREARPRFIVARLTAVWGVSIWVYVTSYVLPSISPAKNHRIGDAFLFLTLSYGAARLFSAMNLLSRIKWCLPLNREFLRPAITASIVLVCSAIVAADIRGAHLTLNAWPAYQRDKELSRKMTKELEKSLNRWAEKHDLEHVPIRTFGYLGIGGAFNTDSILSRPGMDRVKGTRLWTGYSEWDDIVVAIIPVVDPTMRQFQFVRGYDQEKIDEALSDAEANGFEHYDHIEIMPGIELEIFTRPDHQLNEKDYEPTPNYP